MITCFCDLCCLKVIIGELLSLATIVAYIVCSLFWKSSNVAYQSLDSDTREEEEEVSQKPYLIFRIQKNKYKYLIRRKF